MLKKTDGTIKNGHWTYKTQADDKQSKKLATVEIQDTGHTRHMTYKTHDIQDTGR